MDYFPNGDFSKSYPLPGIGYYMSNMPPTVPNGQPQQGILGLTAPTFDGQQFIDGNDYSAFQHQQYQQQTAVAPPRQQYMVGQKRKSNHQQNAHLQQQYMRDDPNATGEMVGKDGRKLDPFAPECSIPLPYQLGDEYRCVVKKDSCAVLYCKRMHTGSTGSRRVD